MSNFDFWKLQSTGDYLFFFALGLTGLLALYALYLKLKYGRSEEGASKRVAKVLANGKPKDGILFNDVVLNLGGKNYTLDHLLIDSKGILMIKRYSWGIGLYGMADDVNWVVKDSNHEERVTNPLPELLEVQRQFTTLLSKHDFYGIHFHELIILADTYDEPVSYLEKEIDVVTYNKLKKKMKARREMPTVLPSYQQIGELIKACEVKE